MIRATPKTWERLKLERRNLDRTRYADWFEHIHNKILASVAEVEAKLGID
jgi:hypothetical protein